MTSVLLLDASFAARPIHDWLLGQGFDVWTMGNRPGDLLARRNPDRHIGKSYHDPETVQTYVDRLNIRHVVPGCTDISIETAVLLEVPGTHLDAPDTYDQLANKRRFRSLCAKLDLPAPRQVRLNDLPRLGRFIVKPTDAFSGRGITVFDGTDLEAAKRAVALAQSESRSGQAIIETFADGQLHSYSCFLEARQVVDATIVREDGSVTPYAVDTSHVRTDFPAAGIAILRDSIEHLARHLGLVDGLLHAQFIWDGESPQLIELSRRCPGDLYPWLVQLSTGKPHAARYASYFLGRTAPIAAQTSRHILRHTVTAGHDNYEGIWFTDPALVLEFHPLATTGRETPKPTQIDRVALVFLELQTVEALAVEHERFFSRKAYRSQIREA